MAKVKAADAKKVRSSIKTFLEKMKALDSSIPEELAEDALEMAEEVNDALCAEVEDEDVDVLEVTRDAEETMTEAKMEDALVRVLRKHGIIKDTAMTSLDNLEKELEDAECNSLDADGEEEVTVDPESMNDSSVQLRKLIRQIKPIVAGVKDSTQRSKLSDAIAKMARLNSNDEQYASVLNATKKKAADTMETKSKTKLDDNVFGMETAMKFNPHYKKEG